MSVYRDGRSNVPFRMRGPSRKLGCMKSINHR